MGRKNRYSGGVEVHTFLVGLKCRRRFEGNPCNCLEGLYRFEESRKNVLEMYEIDIADYCITLVVALEDPEGKDFDSELFLGNELRDKYAVEAFELRKMYGASIEGIIQASQEAQNERLQGVRLVVGIVQKHTKAMVEELAENMSLTNSGQLVNDIFDRVFSIIREYL